MKPEKVGRLLATVLFEALAGANAVARDAEDESDIIAVV